MHLLDRDTDRWTTVIEGVEATTWFRVDVDRERLVGATTLDAPKGRLVAALLGDPAPERWVDLVPEGDDVLTGFALTGEHLVVLRTRAGVSSLHHHEPSGRPVAEITVGHRRPGGGHRAGEPPQPPGPGRRGAHVVHPPRHRHRLATRRRAGRAHHAARARRSTRRPSPRSATRRPTARSCRCCSCTTAATTVDERTPTLLTGYGGFNITETPAWSPFIATWCELGGQVAIPGLRGGGEEGEAWHQAGMRDHKPQVFADFEAAADWLVAEGPHLTRPPRHPRRLERRPARRRVRGAPTRPVPGGRVRRARSPTWCASRASSSPASGSPSTATPTCPRSWRGSTPTRRTTRWSTAPPTRPRSSPPARRTAASTRATPASSPPASRRRRRNEVLLRVESAAGHGQGKPATKQIEERADVLAFLRLAAI